MSTRSLAGLVGLSEKDAANDDADDPRRQLAGQSDLLAEPKDRRFLSGLNSDAAARDRHDDGAAEHARYSWRGDPSWLAAAGRTGHDRPGTERRGQLVLQRPARHRHLCDAPESRSRGG